MANGNKQNNKYCNLQHNIEIKYNCTGIPNTDWFRKLIK